MKDNSNRNVLAIVVVLVMGGLIYISNQDTPLVEEYTPLPSVVGFDEPTIEDLPTLTEAVIVPESESLASNCLLYTSPSPRDGLLSRMPSSA